jgi:hypothetical protein
MSSPNQIPKITIPGSVPQSPFTYSPSNNSSNPKKSLPSLPVNLSKNNSDDNSNVTEQTQNSRDFESFKTNRAGVEIFQEFSADSTKASLKIKFYENLYRLHLLGQSAMLGKKPVFDKTLQIFEIEHKKFINSLNLPPIKLEQPLREDLILELNEEMNQHFPNKALVQMKTGLSTQLLDLSAFLFSEENRKRIAGLIPNSNTDLKIMKQLNYIFEGTENKATGENPNILLDNFTALKKACQILEFYNKTLNGICKKLRQLSSYIADTNEIFLITSLMDWIKHHENLIITKFKHKITQDQEVKFKSEIKEYFISKVLELIEKIHLEQVKSRLDTYWELLIQIIKKRPKVENETLDELENTLYNNLFVKRIFSYDDLPRALTDPKVHLYFYNGENFEQIDLLEESGNIENIEEKRFKLMLDAFNELFFNDKKIFDFLVEKITSRLTPSNNQNAIGSKKFSQIFTNFYTKFFTLIETDKKKLSETDKFDKNSIQKEFNEKFPGISFDKALKYLLLTFNFLNQETTYLIQKFLLEVVQLKLNKQEGIIRGAHSADGKSLEEQFALKAYTQPSYRVYLSHNSIEVNYDRNEGVYHQELLLHTNYSFRYDFTTDTLTFPTQFFIKLECPKELLEDIKVQEGVFELTLMTKFMKLDKELKIEYIDPIK